MDDQQVLRSAMATGVMVVRQDGTNYCVACEKTPSEPMPHLKGRDHENHLVWYILQHPSPPQELLRALPVDVLKAKLSDEIELVNKAHFSYRCRVCPKKNQFTGIEPLKSHLNGNDHKKAKKNMQVSSHALSSQSNQDQHQTSHHPQQLPSSSQTHGMQPTYLQQTPNPSLLSSPLPQNQYNPNIESRSSQVPSLHSQLSSGQHLLPSFLQHNTSLPAYLHPSQPQMPSQINTPFLTHGSPDPRHPSGSTQTPVSQGNTNMAASTVQHDWMNREILPPEVQRALDDSVVERGQGSSAYKCMSCNNSFTGLAPLLEHLRSDKHKKKASLFLPDLSTLKIGSDGQHVRNIQFESAWIGLGRSDQTDGPWTFPWTVVSTRHPQMPSETVYRNLSTPRGLVLIFNYYFTGQGIDERTGAARDSFNLKTLFHQMGYVVYLYEDKNKSETEEILKKQQDNQFLRRFDSLIVFVLSHGKDYLHFACREGEFMSLDEVRYCFTDSNCPTLSGKPKLFFANYCRGKQIEPRMQQYDSLSVQQMAPKDMMTMYACIENFRAPRDLQRGTIFVQVLCEVLAAHAHCLEMRDLVIKINNLTKERGGATPEYQLYDFKKFFFNPSQQ